MPAIISPGMGVFLRKVSPKYFTYIYSYSCELDELICRIQLLYNSSMSTSKLRKVLQPNFPMMIQNNLRTVANDAFGRLTSPYPLLNYLPTILVLCKALDVTSS